MFFRLFNISRIKDVVIPDHNVVAREDWGVLDEDNPICAEHGHLHSMNWPKKEDWHSPFIHGASCFRCGWIDPCPWT
jgi:hypothetical protein